MPGLPKALEDAALGSVDPDGARLVLQRLFSDGISTYPYEIDRRLAEAVALVAGASRALSRLLVADKEALGALAGALYTSYAGPPPLVAAVAEAEDEEELAREKELAYLQIAALDLSGGRDLVEVTKDLSELADAVLRTACRLAATEGLAVVAMGKHGALELNYASDVDVVFVSSEGLEPEAAAVAARRVLKIAGRCYRMDTDLRPEGRNGALVRSLASYNSYWEHWAEPWEFQALLKARFSAGDASLGDAFEDEAGRVVFERGLDADGIAQLRKMKSRSEAAVAGRGLEAREIKRGRGGIRDIEFAVQLLQLVHGPADLSLRRRDTLGALAELASAGYVDGGDAATLSIAYRFYRTVEHRLQLAEGSQTHTMPSGAKERERLAGVLGFSPSARRARGRAGRLDSVLARYQASVRAIHERLYFRPLLEVFSLPPGRAGALTTEAAEARLQAFGFTDSDRTRQALGELTRGLTRSSRLMAALLPVLLGWLSESPDPDLGLTALRNMAARPHQRDVVVAAFRESPELARRLCLIVGTGRRLGDLAQHDPALALKLGEDGELVSEPGPRRRERFLLAAQTGRHGLRRLVGSEVLRIASADLVGLAGAVETGSALAGLGDLVVAALLAELEPEVPFGVVGLGRYGGNELSYGSDLDLVFVYDGTGDASAKEALRVANGLSSALNGATPAERIFTTDTSLRPEGRRGPLVRSMAAHREYQERWISAWERLALVRARPVAGDGELLSSYKELTEETLWRHELGRDELREIRRLKARTEKERIPAGEDPQFHLKLGRGSLADIEWTVQALQLSHHIPARGTTAALGALAEKGILSEEESSFLSDAFSFLTATRARWHLVGSYISAGGGLVNPSGSDSLPTSPPALRRLARSLESSPRSLREEYRRVTRRARRVVESRFYGI